MKKHSIIIHNISVLIIFSVIGISFAGEDVEIVEMADGHYLTFPAKTEEQGLYVRPDHRSGWLKPAAFSKSDKPGREFELAESGITVSFSSKGEETAVEDFSNFSSVSSQSDESLPPKQQVVKIELSESGNYILFPVNREKNNQIGIPFYSRNLR